jgi:hypothetical protein
MWLERGEEGRRGGAGDHDLHPFPLPPSLPHSHPHPIDGTKYRHPTPLPNGHSSSPFPPAHVRLSSLQLTIPPPSPIIPYSLPIHILHHAIPFRTSPFPFSSRTRYEISHDEKQFIITKKKTRREDRHLRRGRRLRGPIQEIAEGGGGTPGREGRGIDEEHRYGRFQVKEVVKRKKSRRTRDGG